MTRPEIEHWSPRRLASTLSNRLMGRLTLTSILTNLKKKTSLIVYFVKHYTTRCAQKILHQVPFLSLWYYSTRDWTPVSRTTGEYFTHLANTGPTWSNRGNGVAPSLTRSTKVANFTCLYNDPIKKYKSWYLSLKVIKGYKWLTIHDRMININVMSTRIVLFHA